jgi:hypothetical protein
MSAPDVKNEPDRPRRVRWTLRSMMIAIALFALIFGLVAWEVRRVGVERDRALRAMLEAEKLRYMAEVARANELLAQAAADQSQAATAATADQLKAENERLRAEVERLRRELERLGKPENETAR